jgi:hypothetical protein
MEIRTLDAIWYRAEPHTEPSRANPFVRERGRLRVGPEVVVFQGPTVRLEIREILSVDYGVHGSMRNPSVHVRWREGEAVREAWFTDGGMGGYAGLFGGTRTLAELLAGASNGASASAAGGAAGEAAGESARAGAPAARFDDAAAGRSQRWWLTILGVLVLLFLARVVLSYVQNYHR